jgi:site-specific recombinase XerC
MEAYGLRSSDPDVASANLEELQGDLDQAKHTGKPGVHGVLRPVDRDGEPPGVSAATVRRRLSVVSGFFAFLQARGDVAANPVPLGLPTRRERSRPGQGVTLVRVTRRLPRILSHELRHTCLTRLKRGWRCLRVLARVVR